MHSPWKVTTRFWQIFIVRSEDRDDLWKPHQPDYEAGGVKAIAALFPVVLVVTSYLREIIRLTSSPELFGVRRSALAGGINFRKLCDHYELP